LVGERDLGRGHLSGAEFAHIHGDTLLLTE
jgi:hypothetical protein